MAPAKKGDSGSTTLRVNTEKRTPEPLLQVNPRKLAVTPSYDEGTIDPKNFATIRYRGI